MQRIHMQIAETRRRFTEPPEISFYIYMINDDMSAHFVYI